MENVAKVDYLLMENILHKDRRVKIGNKMEKLCKQNGKIMFNIRKLPFCLSPNIDRTTSFKMNPNLYLIWGTILLRSQIDQYS